MWEEKKKELYIVKEIIHVLGERERRPERERVRKRSTCKETEKYEKEESVLNYPMNYEVERGEEIIPESKC